MKSFVLTTTLLVAFAALPNLACSTNNSSERHYRSDYAHDYKGDNGAFDITGKTYNVYVEGNRNDSAQDVYDEALYKAARKTLDKDYDWFRVIDRDTEKEVTRTENRSGFESRYERVPVQSCGLLGCRTTTRTYRRDSFDTGFPDREETRYSVDLEFEVGKGQTPAAGDVYDAKMVRRSYR